MNPQSILKLFKKFNSNSTSPRTNILYALGPPGPFLYRGLKYSSNYSYTRELDWIWERLSDALEGAMSIHRVDTDVLQVHHFLSPLAGLALHSSVKWFHSRTTRMMASYAIQLIYCNYGFNMEIGHLLDFYFFKRTIWIPNIIYYSYLIELFSVLTV